MYFQEKKSDFNLKWIPVSNGKRCTRSVLCWDHRLQQVLYSSEGCGGPVVKVSDHGRHVMSSSPVPLKTRRNLAISLLDTDDHRENYLLFPKSLREKSPVFFRPRRLNVKTNHFSLASFCEQCWSGTDRCGLIFANGYRIDVATQETSFTMPGDSVFFPRVHSSHRSDQKLRKQKTEGEQG
ncbi:hypothetical protein TNCV_3054491 [Trichonephila clavipes]|nr:hypothetical protein TNCV_3054491 [Trichonephila clavipes]